MMFSSYKSQKWASEQGFISHLTVDALQLISEITCTGTENKTQQQRSRKLITF